MGVKVGQGKGGKIIAGSPGGGEAGGGSDLITAQSTFTITDAPDGRKKLQRDGSDFLMVGMYYTILVSNATKVSKRLADIASSEGIFNFLFTPLLLSDGATFDKCAEHGLYLAVQNNDPAGDVALINAFTDKVAFAIHSPTDDVDFSEQTVQQVTDKIALVEGAKDVIAHSTGNDSTSTRPPYIGIGEEINSSQVYPYSAEPSSRAWFGFRNARTNDDNDGNTTLLAADLQAYDSGGGFPPAIDTRIHFWAAVANGCRAFIWYALDDDSGYDWFAQTAHADEVEALITDAKAIESTIHNASSTEQACTADAECFMSVLDNGDQTGILIVANLKEVAGAVVLNETAVGGATGSGALTKTFNDARYASGLSLSSEGVLTGTVAHKEVHVYNVTTPPPLANRIRYVNTASTAGGDGTTSGISGANRAYASMSEALDAEAANLVAANVVLRIKCMGSAADTTAVALETATGYTTSPINRIVVETDSSLSNSAHNGTAGSGFTHEVANGTSRGFDIKNDIDITLDGITFNKGASSTGRVAVRTQNNVNGQKVTIKNCIFYSDDANLTGIQLADGEAEHTIYNNLFYDCATGIEVVKTGTNEIANNTIIDCITGIATNTGSTLTNNLIEGATTSISGTSASETTNLESPGTVTFANAAGDDFKLSGSDTVAKDQGTDLSSTLGESVDFIGNSRSGTWDIGCHEV